MGLMVLPDESGDVQNIGMKIRVAGSLANLVVSPCEFFRATRHLYDDEKVYVYNVLAPASNPPAKYVARFDAGPVTPSDIRAIWPLGKFILMLVANVSGRGMLIRRTEVTAKHGVRVRRVR
jgi:hypothetical protein